MSNRHGPAVSRHYLGGARYDPWADLARRTGVEIKWHASPKQGPYKNCRGLTDFGELSVSLLLGLHGFQLRTTLAHELAHLDRGPVKLTNEKQEE